MSNWLNNSVVILVLTCEQKDLLTFYATAIALCFGRNTPSNCTLLCYIGRISQGFCFTRVANTFTGTRKGLLAFSVNLFTEGTFLLTRLGCDVVCGD